MWRGTDIAEVVLDGLGVEEASLLTEQSVKGLDARREVELHESIAAAIRRAGFGALREVPYPSLSPAQKKNPDRMRCDVVVTPIPGERVRDVVRDQRERAMREGTLFEDAAPAKPGPEVDPASCLWLEVKCVGQFTYSLGVPGPNTTYASELISAVAGDVKKLAADPLIEHGELLLLLFSASREVAEHDLAVAANRALDRSVPLANARWRHMPIADRAGNSLLTAAVFEAAQSGV